MKNRKTGSLLLVISSEGIPVMVVPATNIADAHNQARMLLRDEKSRAVGPMMARSGVRVTLFQAALFGGDEVLGYLPVEHGETYPETGARLAS